MVKSPRLLFIGTSLLLLPGIRCTQAGELKIVSPSSYIDREGEGSVPEDCCSPYRYQQVFPAADFSGLNNKPHWLVDITFRPDQSVTSARTVYSQDNELRLTTMPVGPPNLSLVFDDNLGSDFKHFYRGPQTNVADVAGPGPGPREFYDSDYSAGVTPYLYDPSQGNLLIDAIGWQGWSPSPRGDQVPGMLTGLSLAGPLATEGGRIGALIHQFTFIPVTAGDYNASGAVEQGDLDLVLLNWGAGAAAVPESWVIDLPSGSIDQAELDKVLLNWGSAASTIATSTVPEPSAAAILLACVSGLVACRKCTRRQVAFNTLN